MATTFKALRRKYKFQTVVEQHLERCGVNRSEQTDTRSVGLLTLQRKQQAAATVKVVANCRAGDGTVRVVATRSLRFTMLTIERTNPQNNMVFLWERSRTPGGGGRWLLQGI